MPLPKKPLALASLKEADYARLAKKIESGRVLLYPTETTYGLGCDARDRAAVTRVFSIKRRPTDVPLLMLVRDEKMLSDYVREIHPKFKALMEKFWPGPLTLVFPAREDKLPLDVLTAGLDTVAVRVSSHPFCRKLLEKLSGPLVSTSANFSGEPTPNTLGEVAASILEEVDVIVNGGTLNGEPSTIVRLEGTEPRIVREGALSKKDLGID